MGIEVWPSPGSARPIPPPPPLPAKRAGVKSSPCMSLGPPGPRFGRDATKSFRGLRGVVATPRGREALREATPRCKLSRLRGVVLPGLSLPDWRQVGFSFWRRKCHAGPLRKSETIFIGSSRESFFTAVSSALSPLPPIRRSWSFSFSEVIRNEKPELGFQSTRRAVRTVKRQYDREACAPTVVEQPPSDALVNRRNVFHLTGHTHTNYPQLKGAIMNSIPGKPRLSFPRSPILIAAPPPASRPLCVPQSVRVPLRPPGWRPNNKPERSRLVAPRKFFLVATPRRHERRAGPTSARKKAMVKPRTPQF